MTARARGFSLIELMIVLAVIGILTAAALPYLTASTEEAKQAKAKNDVHEIARAVYKYNSLEGSLCMSLAELKSKYLANVDTLRDPWGRPYGYDPLYGIAYSSGPDGQHAKFKDKTTWKDDVVVDVYETLVLLEAAVETDPDPSTDERTAYDRLYLTFNKAVVERADTVRLGPSASALTDLQSTGEPVDGDAAAGRIFRWYQGVPPAFMPGESPFAEEVVALVRRTNDPRQVVLVFPPGVTGVLKSATSLNLTGTRKSTNAFFRGLDESKGAVATGSPVRVGAWSGAGIEIDDEVRSLVNELKGKLTPVVRETPEEAAGETKVRFNPPPLKGK